MTDLVPVVPGEVTEYWVEFDITHYVLGSGTSYQKCASEAMMDQAIEHLNSSPTVSNVKGYERTVTYGDLFEIRA